MSYATIASAVISVAGQAYSSYTKSKENKKLGASNYTGASYVPTTQDFSNAQNQVFENAAQQSLKYAPIFTQANIDLQNKVTPGSSDQREAALQKINSYMQGEIPADVQQNIQRGIAQSFGGGYNPFTGGGQAPSAYARNIGQTSVGLSQYGLSAAPTWQQLANSMVTRPDALMGFGIQAGSVGNQQIAIRGQLGQEAATTQYQAGANQAQANNLMNSQLLQGIMNAGSSAASSYGSSSGSGTQSGAGQQNTMNQAGGWGSIISSLMSSYGSGSGGGSGGGGGSYFTTDGTYHTY